MLDIPVFSTVQKYKYTDKLKQALIWIATTLTWCLNFNIMNNNIKLLSFV